MSNRPLNSFHLRAGGAAIIAILLFVTLPRTPAATGRGEQLLGKTAPAFFEAAVNAWSQSPAKYKGKVVLLDFWATWCGPCLREMPAVKKLHRRFQGTDFALIGISLDTDKGRLKKYIRDEGNAWPIVFDGKGWENRVARKYGVRAIPFTVLIDREGVVREVGLRGVALERAVADMLASPR